MSRVLFEPLTFLQTGSGLPDEKTLG
ncbi:hypothetical protein SIAM614_10858 [Stappia aggregata IAM 12614]|uniref:Uncharacterized protein n=1 Tax=Roseibium aggregatum (strain ATCC 25650 / DSM 13394 / JCM 20685 / NBRC 16684 / NCIMB 2208 / IAM 12614 / B1) TaxID=384765 RepID=A0NMM9_ROSAI|nr:hypothetical protein SIAM614_10858 [Stappia aggregata IAM 12614] [Roseibium aggregatum IAM 12614]